MKAEVKDILSEIKTLRHELVNQDQNGGNAYLRTVRFLIDNSEDSTRYREFINNVMKKSVDDVVPTLLKSDTFDMFVENETGHKLEIIDNPPKGNTPSSTTDFLSKFGKIVFHSTSTFHFKKPDIVFNEL